MIVTMETTYIWPDLTIDQKAWEQAKRELPGAGTEVWNERTQELKRLFKEAK